MSQAGIANGEDYRTVANFWFRDEAGVVTSNAMRPGTGM